MTKKELRKVYLEKRKHLSPGELDSISDQIQHVLFSSFPLQDKHISIFLPIEGKHEINTYKILEKALSLGSSVGIPKTDMATFELEQYIYESPEQLEVSSYGIPEPAYGKVVDPSYFDYIFVPLIAVDRFGNRVGYGKGIYDRFLKKCKPQCKFIGLSAFDDFCPDVEGVTENDVRLHMLITPSKLHRFA